MPHEARTLTVRLDPADVFALLNILEQAEATRDIEEADPEARWTQAEIDLTQRLRHQSVPFLDARAVDIDAAIRNTLTNLGVVPTDDDSLEVSIIARRLGVLDRIRT